jgi:hypothetical protein
MTGNEVNDLPEVTFAKRMALQANLISKYQIANEIINESNSENTLQFDKKMNVWLICGASITHCIVNCFDHFT